MVRCSSLQVRAQSAVREQFLAMMLEVVDAVDMQVRHSCCVTPVGPPILSRTSSVHLGPDVLCALCCGSCWVVRPHG